MFLKIFVIDPLQQRPIPQTLCGALQKEANCKCLVLSVLIYGCLAAVTWCRCANVTKVVIDFLKYPITSTKHVSPCDDGYVYIPVAFMGMLYLVYLVECYHSPIRIDLLHARSQDSILTKLAQLKMAKATIWWKAISYHYVRRKRQITRYRNGDNYTTTQVYYERVNTHAATSFYFYGYCGVKDISKELLLDPKLPITKISLTKGFAFSNMRSATEFEEARSRFFAEQEHRDDYMEMREGLDLGYNFNPTSLVAVLGKPWFTNAYVYWSLSALLLSWPLRIIIECNTQYTDYQITKLFGVNYDAPTANGQPIHASSSQLSAPGSYMLVPSYSEALLMEPAPVPVRSGVSEEPATDMVPSYSEALLYERAYDLQGEVRVEQCPEAAGGSSGGGCECPCHGQVCEAGIPGGSNRSSMEVPEEAQDNCSVGNIGRPCSSCSEEPMSVGHPDPVPRLIGGGSSRGSAEALSQGSESTRTGPQEKPRHMPRENSEPNLRTSSDQLFCGSVPVFGRGAARLSLENILEHDETVESDFGTRAEALILEEDDDFDPRRIAGTSRGAIPKTLEAPAERPKKIPSSRTYFCIKSILKQHRRRYTLVTPEELQNLVGLEQNGDVASTSRGCNPQCCGAHWERIDVNSNTLENGMPRRGQQLFQGSLDSLSSGRLSEASSMHKRDSSRTLIFASPIQEICPSDPFGGRTLVPSENPPDYEDALDLPVLSRLKRSFTERETRTPGAGVRKHHRTFSIEPEYLFSGNRGVERRCQGDGMPYDVVIPVQNSRVIMPSQYRRTVSEDGASGSSGCCREQEPESGGRLSRLTRSLTERTSSRRNGDRDFRRSLTDRIEFSRNRPGSRKVNINMETSL
ncbi:transmembrane protein 151B-like isoform X1 [Neodiprion lecontei]|uniref:Transmembrane protein 151B-like isoform X1 n=1 Tax=Neodiprion lecontei TaxID=441921 RepID=A0ABM3GHH1_NEOLC|nr:transmembrane protein 151B-like isoform X1 [Neodiprion lecontei]